ncbi:MAG: 3'(2'),5'-bisphosphate nucleotidase CysQ [Rhodobacteraceae bacterium]|nr:3'(2'),5'-bisphosphate nucleotidase CysQ [Paracoccaceae bacterium]
MPGRDLDLLRDAALAAGEIAGRYFRQAFDVRDKGDGQGPVTEADIEIDRMLRADLLAARPGYGWLSEETEDSAARLSRERVFIVDPIDGTRSFVNGDKTFAHSLAVAEAGRVVAACVHLPMRGLTYAAALGEGAFLNGEPLRGSRRAGIEAADVLAARPQLEPGLWPGGVPPVTRHFRSSLAYRLCLTAQGRFDGMVTLRDAWEWDIAAGDLICREAGVTITDRLGAALRFNNPVPKQAGVLAGGAAVHAGFLRHLVPTGLSNARPIP